MTKDKLLNQHTMKKIILFASLVLAGFAMNAQTEQEPNKKKETKETKAPNTTQGRAINEKGVSVKTRGLSKKTAKEKAIITEKDKKIEPKKNEEAKP